MTASEPGDQINDAEFGVLTWDAQLAWWSGSLELSPGRRGQLQISTPSDSDRTITHKVRQAFARLFELEPQLRRRASADLLPICNSEWQSESPVTPDRFIERLGFESATLYPDGSGEIIFTDDGMFFGHVVLVSFDENGGIDEATIGG